MREEILRILRLVEQGRIKPDEAAELIELNQLLFLSKFCSSAKKST